MMLVKEGLKLKKHLSLDERFDIENSLCKGLSFKEIARNIGKDCTTISREIRNHYIVKKTGGIGRQFNNCIYRTTCPNKGKNCKLSSCAEFVEENRVYVTLLKFFSSKTFKTVLPTTPELPTIATL